MTDVGPIPSENGGDNDDASALIAAVTANLRDHLARVTPPGLHLVATPIGNLGDISARALATLLLADRVYCEDTRTSRPLLARFSIRRELATYHEHNAETVRREILASLAEGASVALISDAGSPAISDPGFKLVRDAAASGFDVFAVPGPTALAAAVTVSGLPTDSFFFAGFLPQKLKARRDRIVSLADIDATLIFYESPHRLGAALDDLADLLGAREAAVARELTKKFEEVRRGTLSELGQWAKATPPRGEIAIVVAGHAASGGAIDVTDETIAAQLTTALLTMRPSVAAKSVAESLGVARSRVYDIAVTLKQGPS